MLNFPARRVLCPSHKPMTGWTLFLTLFTYYTIF